MEVVRPVRNSNQVMHPKRSKKKVRKIRRRQKVARVSPQNKELRAKVLPRRPQRPRQRHQPRPPPLQRRHQPRPPPLQHRHQALRLQRRQLCRPPTHRHVFAKSTAASAALRGCVPRWCLPHPRWRTPLWAEEVCAGCAFQHSTAGIFVRVLLSYLLNKRNDDCVLLHLLLLPCCVLRVVPRFRHVERIADTLTSMRTGALGLFFFFNFFFLIIVFYCFLNLWFAGRCASSAIALIPSVSWCVLLLGCCRLLLCVLHRPHTHSSFSLSVCVSPCMDSRPHLTPRSTHNNVPIVYVHAHPCRPVGALFCATRTAAVLPGCMGGAP
ncbi:hypothetical protein TCDM_09912 [Trypanosoma cruzi Dm28c]|uniref:Mucin TcMUCII n=1 Tax=Trypanosoma cruzi Dm28c TaxID=1416333 RepID=V5B8R3_TRYCR|nr:hypothetical protein TCDM_09912 [Trypanosoma cruzi Dm28c]